MFMLTSAKCQAIPKGENGMFAFVRYWMEIVVSGLVRNVRWLFRDALEPEWVAWLAKNNAVTVSALHELLVSEEGNAREKEQALVALVAPDVDLLPYGWAKKIRRPTLLTPTLPVEKLSPILQRKLGAYIIDFSPLLKALPRRKIRARRVYSDLILRLLKALPSNDGLGDRLMRAYALRDPRKRPHDPEAFEPLYRFFATEGMPERWWLSVHMRMARMVAREDRWGRFAPRPALAAYVRCVEDYLKAVNVVPNQTALRIQMEYFLKRGNPPGSHLFRDNYLEYIIRALAPHERLQHDYVRRFVLAECRFTSEALEEREELRLLAKELLRAYRGKDEDIANMLYRAIEERENGRHAKKHRSPPEHTD